MNKKTDVVVLGCNFAGLTVSIFLHCEKRMPFVDDQGFVKIDRYMRNPDFKDMFTVGDAASVMVPKLGSIL